MHLYSRHLSHPCRLVVVEISLLHDALVQSHLVPQHRRQSKPNRPDAGTFPAATASEKHHPRRPAHLAHLVSAFRHRRPTGTQTARLSLRQQRRWMIDFFGHFDRISSVNLLGSMVGWEVLAQVI